MNRNITDVQRRLAAYLEAQVTYLRVLASGWETIIFEFSLGASSPRERELPPGQPLVLRWYQGSRGVDKGTREFTIMRLLADIKYPLPRPFLFEPNPESLGAPFLIMERVQ